MKLYTSLILYLTMLIIVIVSTKRAKSLRKFGENMGFKKIKMKSDLPWALFYVMVLFLISIVIQIVFFYAGFGEDMARVSETLQRIEMNHLLTIMITASFVEEIFFRGYLQARTNILFASFVFGFFHITYGSLVQVVGTFILGAILGIEFKHRKGLFCPIFSHLTYNLIRIAIM